jgi:murein DD-endopeptidase MepM/ murein hydrolase activator NlpD
MKRYRLLTALLAIAIFSFSFKEKTPASKKKKSSVAAVSKTLAYPVAGKRSMVGSFWGASRGGGVRKHKGIDIFASKGTPVVALADGRITLKETTKVGGKVLWLKPTRHNWEAYYAHLDKQLVKEGQYVRKGQVIGTVGNTGNAKHTPSHLHFGIYTDNGPINPLPYVKRSPKVVVSKAVKKKTAVKKKASGRKPVKRK